MAILIEVTGDIKPVQPTNGESFKLDEAQKMVGGYVEVIRLTNNQILLINEEGKLEALGRNAYATQLALASRAIYPNDYIVGSVVLCNDQEFK